MSRYYYPPHTSPFEEEDEFNFSNYQTHAPQGQQSYQEYADQNFPPILEHGQLQGQPAQYYQTPQQPQQFSNQWAQPMMPLQPQTWVTPTVPSNAPYQQQTAFPQYSESSIVGFSSPELSTAGPSTGYLSPGETSRTRISRTTSFASNASSSYSHSDVSRSTSPSASEMARWGRRNDNGTWRCAYPGCTSRSTFSRGCDLRKHYKRHTKSLFCRTPGCPQSTEGGFSSKKDRARHEAKHDPKITCEWPECGRVFSRVDNMKDHVRRVHRKRQDQ